MPQDILFTIGTPKNGGSVVSIGPLGRTDGNKLDSTQYSNQYLSESGILDSRFDDPRYYTGNGPSNIETVDSAASVTFNMRRANIQSITLEENVTLAVEDVSVGQSFVVRLKQDGTGSRTVTWWSTINWPGGLVPTLTTTPNKTDVFSFICVSDGVYDGFVAGYSL